jgi:hypothetical protein
MLAVVPVEAAWQFAAKGMLRVLAIDFDCGLGNYGIATSEAQLLSPACSRFIEVLARKRVASRKRRLIAGVHEERRINEQRISHVAMP